MVAQGEPPDPLSSLGEGAERPVAIRSRWLRWVTSSDLDRWAALQQGVDILPVLLRRLIAASSPKARYHFRAHEGVRLPGWDGKVTCPETTAFIPEGLSAWELGTGKDPGRKATADYCKRTADPGEVIPEHAHFIFATPRRWSDKEAWAETRRKSGPWRGVRVLDADDLEPWLDSAPAVRSWFSRLLGKVPQGAEDLEIWWQRFSHRTNPPVATELVLGGREDARSALLAGLSSAPGLIRVTAESELEATAFVAASVLGQGEETALDAILSRAVLVSEKSAWQQLEQSPQPLILIPDGLDPTGLTAATRNGHWIIQPGARLEDGVATPDVALELPKPESLRSGLQAMGLDEETSTRLVRRSRRRLSVLVRELSPWDRPSWIDEVIPPELVVAFLVGAWADDREADRAIVAKLAGRPYREIVAALAPLTNRPGSPLTSTDGVLSWASRAEAGRWLVGRLDRRLLTGFQSVAVEVLGELDPRFDLPERERWAAALHGKSPAHSPQLRRGVAEGLALLGTSDLVGAERLTGAAVRSLLYGARDWRRWATLGELLRSLAEAAPDDFLESVESVARCTEVVAPLLSDSADTLGGGCDHSGLLWALEVLAWSPDYLAASAENLAELACRDPGGRWSNRPSESLRAIFLPWRPQTTASAEHRLGVIVRLGETHPEVAWSLALSLMPRGADWSASSARPNWREWHLPAPGDVLVSTYYTHVNALSDTLVGWAGTSPTKWADLIDSFHPEWLFRKGLTVLEPLVPQLATAPLTDPLRRSFRRVLHRHRTWADADWSFPDELLVRIQAVYDAFEPEDLCLRVAWCFDRAPSPPAGSSGEREEEVRELQELRGRAVDELLSHGIESIESLAPRVEAPDQLGWSIGLSLRDERLFLSLHEAAAEAADPWGLPLRTGLIRGRSFAVGPDWAREFLARRVADGWGAARCGSFAAALPFEPSVWDLVDELGPGTRLAYWSDTPVGFEQHDAAAPRAVRELLSVDRPFAALSVTSRAVRPGDTSPAVPGDLIAEVLLTAGVADPRGERPAPPTLSLSYHVPRLMDAAEVGGVSPAELASLEWVWLGAFDSPRTRPARLESALAGDPDLFVKLLSLVNARRGEDSASEPPSVKDRRRAEAAYRLLQGWRRLPGADEGGGLDVEQLFGWVSAARERCRAVDRADVGDRQIGQLLACAPPGTDGIWPHEAVREVIERTRSRTLELWVSSGVRNRRGVVSRAIGEGGRQEYALEARYREAATQVSARWPRTARVLREIARSYGDEARRQDIRARLDEDTFL